MQQRFHMFAVFAPLRVADVIDDHPANILDAVLGVF